MERGTKDLRKEEEVELRREDKLGQEKRIGSKELRREEKLGNKNGRGSKD
jgi:hypothetical protein